MVMLRCFVIALLSFVASRLFGQKLLFHKNNYKEEAYQVGEIISFRLQGNKSKITRQILGFEDSLIVFRDYRINPNEISDMYVDRKTIRWFILRYKYKNVLPAIGGGYLLLELVNTGEANKNTLVFSGSFIVAGIMAKLFIPNRIKIKGRRKLVIVE
eukprot:NODE_764_length_2376_cov_41.742565_g653_i0.p3 GENE.NODE_764_length_2376_cov_41.742565_g653_i0~~NODE_764_length_2376_cov_41.742565_g653_i0.p3  ORF type:complete len:157 (-),score=1.33 NODE_764_length_2376_cov_41.742565_g653_i0:1618-2088(-)